MSGHPHAAQSAALPFTPRDLRRLRRLQEMPLSRAAQSVGIDPSYLSLIERELRPCPPELGLKLLRLFWGQPQFARPRSANVEAAGRP